MSYPPGPPNDGDPTPGNGEQGQPDYGQQPGYGQPSYPPPGQPGQPGSGPGSGPGFPPQYGQYGYPQGPQAPRVNGKATASLITGISTLVLSWCCGLGIAGVVAIVLGVKARSEITRSGGAQSGDGLALGGIITGAFAVLFGLVGLVVIVYTIASGNANYNVDYGSDPNSF